MTGSEIFFSLIIPVYNVEKYLDATLESVVAQTYNNFEVILVDDGSKDLSCEICDKWAEKDNRIKVIHKQNGGVSSARNEGMRQARGEYVLFLDADDLLTTGLFEHCNDYICENTDVDVFFFSLAYRYNDGKLVDAKMFEKGKYVFKDEKDKADFFIKLLPYSITYCPRGCYKKVFLQRYGLWFNENYAVAEDIDFLFLMFLYTKEYIETGFLGYIYVQREDSCTHVKKGKIILNQMNKISYNLYLSENRLGLIEFERRHYLIHNYLVNCIGLGLANLETISAVGKNDGSFFVVDYEDFYKKELKKALKNGSKIKYNEFRPNEYKNEKFRRAILQYSLNNNKFLFYIRLICITISIPFVKFGAKITRRIKGLFKRRNK